MILIILSNFTIAKCVLDEVFFFVQLSSFIRRKKKQLKCVNYFQVFKTHLFIQTKLLFTRIIIYTGKTIRKCRSNHYCRFQNLYSLHDTNIRENLEKFLLTCTVNGSSKKESSFKVLPIV